MALPENRTEVFMSALKKILQDYQEGRYEGSFEEVKNALEEDLNEEINPYDIFIEIHLED